MSLKPLPAALLLALLPLAAVAEEPAPAVAAPAAEAPASAPAPDRAAAPASTAESPAAGLPAVSDTPAQDSLGASPTPPMGKRACNMKGKGMMGGQGAAMDMAPGKICDRPGRSGCGCGHGGGRGVMHQDVVERLDLIEARLAKIEALLESLVRR